MSCYSPLRAYRRESGDVAFFEGPRDLGTLELPCGRCVGCRLARASSWALRCQHEAQLYSMNAFVTLTYDDAHLPQYGSLCYADVQRFLKRLRRSTRGIEAGPNGRFPVRFFCAGEYGETSYRPHYHLLLFNYWFRDSERFGEDTFRSSALERLWPLGQSIIGSVTPASVAYVARYSLKKVYGRAAGEFYSWVDKRTGEVCECVPEFCVPSRRPGIGAWWYEKYRSDVLPRDYVVSEGRKHKVPRYYLNKFAAEDAVAADDVKAARLDALAKMPLSEKTPERRRVREAVAVANLEHFHGKRGF